jgi:hypothetical protein
MVYESFQTQTVAKTGVVPMPDIKKEKLIGGHAIALNGYDDEKKVFTFQNSWSQSWGDNGYGYIPYSFIDDSNLTADCHIITSCEIDKSPAPTPTPTPQPQPPQPFPTCPYPHLLPCPFHSFNPYNPYNPYHR